MDSTNSKEDENAKTEAEREEPNLEDSNSDTSISNVSTKTASEVNHSIDECSDSDDEADEQEFAELREWCEQNLDTECESPPMPRRKVRRTLRDKARAIEKSEKDELFEKGIEFDRSTPSTSTAHLAPRINFFDPLPNYNLMSHFPIRHSKNAYEMTRYLKSITQSDEESPVEDSVEEMPVRTHTCRVPGCNKWYDSNRALNRHVHLNHRKRYLPTPSLREQLIYCKRFKRIRLSYNCIITSKAFAIREDLLAYARGYKPKSAIIRRKYRDQVFIPAFLEENEHFLWMKKLLRYLSEDRRKDAK